MGLHICITEGFAENINAFAKDLRECTAEVIYKRKVFI